MQQILDARVIVPNHIAFRVFPGKTVVLNLDNGTYHGLNSIGGRMLGALEEGVSPREAASRLAKDLGQPRERILNDLTDLIVKLERQGLVEVTAGTSHRVDLSPRIGYNLPPLGDRPRHELPPPLAPLTRFEKTHLVVEILVIYIYTSLRLRRKDVKILNEVPRSDRSLVPDPSPAQTAALADRLGNAVAQALRSIPTDPRCLTRSLVLLRLLSRKGIDASLVIGVRHENEPFTAHAWVEHRGIPLLDPGGKLFSRLLQIETARVA
jgi:hypothetical protein